MERATTMPEAIRELASSWPAAEQKWIAEFIGKIRADYSQVVRRAMLYGSKARGDAGPTARRAPWFPGAARGRRRPLDASRGR